MDGSSLSQLSKSITILEKKNQKTLRATGVSGKTASAVLHGCRRHLGPFDASRAAQAGAPLTACLVGSAQPSEDGLGRALRHVSLSFLARAPNATSLPGPKPHSHHSLDVGPRLLQCPQLEGGFLTPWDPFALVLPGLRGRKQRRWCCGMIPVVTRTGCRPLGPHSLRGQPSAQRGTLSAPCFSSFKH